MITPQKVAMCLSPGNAPLADPREPLISFLSLHIFVSARFSKKWSHRRWTRLCLPSYTQHNELQMHACCCMYQIKSLFVKYYSIILIPRSYSKHMFDFIRNTWTVSEWLHPFYSHQECMTVPFASNPCQLPILSILLILAILKNVCWYTIVILIFISPVSSYVEYIFTYLLVIHFSSFAKYLFKAFAHFH